MTDRKNVKHILTRVFGKRRPPESPGRAEVLQVLSDIKDALKHGRLLDWQVGIASEPVISHREFEEATSGDVVRFDVMVELFR
jgi:hypothetical protein